MCEKEIYVYISQWFIVIIANYYFYTFTIMALSRDTDSIHTLDQQDEFSEESGDSLDQSPLILGSPAIGKTIFFNQRKSHQTIKAYIYTDTSFIVFFFQFLFNS